MLAGISCEHALTETKESIVTVRLPHCLACQGDHRIVTRRRARIACGDERDALPAICDLEVSVHPDLIAQVRGFLDHDATQMCERHPVVATVDDGFEHRAEPGIAVCNP